jgi:hypothetical protein
METDQTLRYREFAYNLRIVGILTQLKNGRKSAGSRRLRREMELVTLSHAFSSSSPPPVARMERFGLFEAALSLSRPLFELRF